MRFLVLFLTSLLAVSASDRTESTKKTESKRESARARRDLLLTKKRAIEVRLIPYALQKSTAIAQASQEETAAAGLDQQASELERRGGTDDLSAAADLRRLAERHRNSARAHRIRADISSSESMALEAELVNLDRQIAAVETEVAR
jgi:hypothetical protein